MHARAAALAFLFTGFAVWSQGSAPVRADRARVVGARAAVAVPRTPRGPAPAAAPHRAGRRFRSALELQVFVVRPGTDEVVEWLRETPASDGVPVHGVWGVRPLAPVALADLVRALRGSGVRALEVSHHCTVRAGDHALLAQLPELEWLEIGHGRVDARALSEIGALRGLRYLGLFGKNLRDDLAALRSLDRLEELDLALNRVGDEGARHLAALPRLERLDLWRADLTEAGYRALVAAPRLRHLRLGGGHSDSTALAGLAGHPTLASLRFEFQDDFTPESIAHLARLPALAHLAFDYCGREWPLAQYRELGRLHGLRSLVLRHTEIPDAGLAELTGLRDLERIEFVEPSLGDAGMRHLLAFPRLRRLTLWDAGITDAGLHVCRMLPELTAVALIGRSDVGDAGLAHLPAGLTHLSVHGRKLREPDFSRFHRLETLRLWDSGVGDEALASLAGVRTLRELDLARTRVTAAGLEHLAPLSRLESLDVRETPAAEAVPAWLARRTAHLEH